MTRRVRSASLTRHSALTMSQCERRVVDFQAKRPRPRLSSRICADPRSADFAATQRKNSAGSRKTIKITWGTHCAAQQNHPLSECGGVMLCVEAS